MNSKIKLSLLIGMILIQLYAPYSLINKYNDTLDKGKLIKLRLEAKDPHDAFRGKYLRLNYSDDEIQNDDLDLNLSTDVYLTFKKVSDYYIPNKISFNEFENRSDQLKCEVFRFKTVREKKNYIRIKYPIDRFYLNEYRSKIAEDVVQKHLRKDSNKVYAVCKLFNGTIVVEDIEINGKKLNELIEQ